MPVAAMLATLVAFPAAAGTQEGRELFRPAGLSQPVYAVGSTTTPEEPVVTDDGTRIHVEIHHPADGPDHEVPDRYPVILIATAYGGVTGEAFPKVATQDLAAASERDVIQGLIDYFVPRGYAVAITDVLGTGGSGGCFDFGGPREADGILAAVEAVGKAPWSTGRVGMWGGSYTAGTQFTAATSGLAGSEHLRAIIPIATQSGAYEFTTLGDGVPLSTTQLGGTVTYPHLVHAVAVGPRVSGLPAARTPACHAELAKGAAEIAADGSFTPWSAEREWRRSMANVQAATLMFHGFHDDTVYVTPTIGSFEAIPASTPKKLVLGQWGHSTGADVRGDVWDMWHAWYDRYLLELATGVEDWPAVQVQDTGAQWREQADWPVSGGLAGQLALGPGSLGPSEPTGSTTFTEEPAALGAGAGTVLHDARDAAVFRSEPMRAPLHLTGVPVADLWVEVSTLSGDPDAHLGVSLRVLDAAGEVVGPPVYWARSLRHLAPLTRGFFEQPEGVTPQSQPVHVPVRLMPTDLIVPEGGRLELTVAGVVRPLDGNSFFASAPSGAGATVTILHDCAHPSALRFLMPDPSSRLLDVVAGDQPAAATSPQDRAAVGARHGGGAALAPVCGRAPTDPADSLRTG